MAETEAAFAAGMAACARDQAAGISDPMAGAVELTGVDPEDVLQPYVPDEPSPSGVT